MRLAMREALFTPREWSSSIDSDEHSLFKDTFGAESLATEVEKWLKSDDRKSRKADDRKSRKADRYVIRKSMQK